MINRLASLGLSFFVCVVAHAATIITALTVTNGTGTFGASGLTFTGPATLTSIGSGTFNATLSLTPTASGDLSAPFTITLTSGDTIKGILAIPASALAGGALKGS